MNRRNERQEAITEKRAKRDETEFLLRCSKCGYARMKVTSGDEVQCREVRLIYAGKTVDHELDETVGYKEMNEKLVTVQEFAAKAQILPAEIVEKLANQKRLPVITGNNGWIRRDSEGWPLLHPVALEVAAVVQISWSFLWFSTEDYERITEMVRRSVDWVLEYCENLAKDLEKQGSVPQLIEDKIDALCFVNRDVWSEEDEEDEEDE